MRVVVVENVTLDGVMQAPARPDEDERDGFAHGGWAVGYGDAVMAEQMGRRMATEGALLLGREVALTPLLHGGGQERDVRSGTLDTPGVVGLAAAVEQSVADGPRRATQLAGLRDDLVGKIRATVTDAASGSPLRRAVRICAKRCS